MSVKYRHPRRELEKLAIPIHAEIKKPILIGSAVDPQENHTFIIRIWLIFSLKKKGPDIDVWDLHRRK
jgi:hypothetical protein